MEIWSKCDICGRDIPVGELCYGLKKGNCICKNCCTGFENCAFTLAPMPTSTPPNEWVSVEEKLPEKKQDVLMLFKSGNMAVGWWHDADEHITFWCAYTDDGFYTDCDDMPTHWMSLPEPPAKE